MDCFSLNRQKLVEQIRFALPLTARARSPLIERLRKIISRDGATSNLLVTSVFDAGDNLGLMCQLDLTQHGAQAPHLVVPLEHLALDRRYGLDRKRQRHRRRFASHSASSS